MLLRVIQYCRLLPFLNVLSFFDTDYYTGFLSFFIEQILKHFMVRVHLTTFLIVLERLFIFSSSVIYIYFNKPRHPARTIHIFMIPCLIVELWPSRAYSLWCLSAVSFGHQDVSYVSVSTDFRSFSSQSRPLMSFLL